MRRDALIEWLATARRSRLIAAARRAGAGADAEDAVQDVLSRLALDTAALPAEAGRALAYATVAVRRRAIDLHRRALGEPRATETADALADEALDRQSALRAFAQAVAGLPETARAVVVLDAAGWSRAAVGARLQITERAVKRSLDRYRVEAVTRAAAAVSGEDCDRLGPTLQAYAAGAGEPRADGPVAQHLEVCLPCRLALARARAQRAALRALYPPPSAFALAPAPAAAAPLLPLGFKVGAAIVAAMAAVGGSQILQPGREAPARAAALRAPVVELHVRAAATGPGLERAGRRSARAALVAARRATPPPPPPPARPQKARVTRAEPRAAAAPVSGGCDLGGLGLCGLEGG